MTTAPGPARSRAALAGALLAGAGVAVALGVVGRVHGVGTAALPTFGFSDEATLKAWAASLVLVLVVAQMGTALWMYGRLPFAPRVPAWVPAAHRATGAAAFVISLPIAAYCLYAFGFDAEPMTPRVLAHSLAGCWFYGIFASKMLIVRGRRMPRWALPIAGGLLFTIVVVLWLSSALWLFGSTGLHR